MTPTGPKAPPQGLTIDDLCKIRKVSTPLLSPDGRYVVYHVTIADFDANDRYELIWLMPADRPGAAVSIARGTAHAWSPDSKELLYETGDGELHIYTAATAISRFLTKRSESNYFINHLALNNCIWSPDGTWIAFAGSDAGQPARPEPGIRVIDHLLYKSKGGRGRAGYADGARTHIYRIPAMGGTPEMITSGPFDEHSITWSPDGRYIAFVSNSSDRPDDVQQSDIWKVDVKTKNTSQISDHQGLAYQPAWSPDGRHIAFLATSGPIGTNDSPAEDTHIALISPDGGPMRYLTQSLDRRVEHLRWHPSGKHIYFTAGNHGDTSMYRVSPENGDIEALQAGEGCISEFCLGGQNGGMLLVKSDTNFPPELFRSLNDGTEARQITQENAAWLAAKSLQTADPFWFESFDGTQVQGWLMKPIHFEPDGRYPLVLVIHGGPHNMFGRDFDERFHLLSQAGYAVVYINPRGSHGYGQSFSKGTLMNWGGGDYQDLMAGVDFILSQHPWLDADRMGVTGQSYGGYMTNWIITQTTRFKAAVADGGLSNLVSFAGTSLYHSLMESEFGGRAYERFELLWKWSPLRNVARVTTPTLLLHGETDNEVPFAQAEEMFVALKKRGVDTQLVQYTGEGHGWRPELSPRNKADLNARMLAWLDIYLNL